MEDPFFEEDPFLYDEDLEQEILHERSSPEDQEAIKQANNIILASLFMFAIFCCIIFIMIKSG